MKHKRKIDTNEILIDEKDLTPHTALVLAFLEINGKKGYDSLKKQGYDFKDFEGLDQIYEGTL
jgi:hypothetical protein